MNTILFDLDGTLLPMDTQQFEKLYFQELGKFLLDLIAPEQLVPLIWSSTKAMVQNTDFRTNETIFMEDLSKRVGADLILYQQKFNEFYQTAFDRVRESVRDVPLIRESVRLLQAKGYQIVLATNPLFPKEALDKRIRWAGLEPEIFSYISTFEQNHYCKPQLKYYEEILKDLNKTPEECLMVGNDVQEDLVAGRLGIQTYLITDHMLNRNNAEIVTNCSGTYQDFYQFVLQLAPIAD